MSRSSSAVPGMPWPLGRIALLSATGALIKPAVMRFTVFGAGAAASAERLACPVGAAGCWHAVRSVVIISTAEQIERCMLVVMERALRLRGGFGPAFRA